VRKADSTGAGVGSWRRSTGKTGIHVGNYGR